jgi:hypothetical protein
MSLLLGITISITLISLLTNVTAEIIIAHQLAEGRDLSNILRTVRRLSRRMLTTLAVMTVTMTLYLFVHFIMDRH